MIVTQAQIEQLVEKLLQLVWIKNAPISLGDNKKIGRRLALWKCWILLLVLSAFSPAEIGKYSWDHFPQMRMLIAYCITSKTNLTPVDIQNIHHQA